uniref:TDP43_N domain-containing protein n=1 Tax=Steinernema glaseri TaxID=37863 RepID=A0A1I7XX21_9BILA
MDEPQTTVVDPDVVHLQVEPVQLGLHPSERSLLLTALRSALPGAAGIYYYDESRSRKTYVNFDGTKFNFPSASKDYYVALGGRCDVPYEKYHAATQNFEKSVMAVQNMLGACSQNDMFRSRTRRSHHDPTTPTSSKRGNMQMLLKTIEQRASSTPVPDFRESTSLTQTAQPSSTTVETETLVPKTLNPLEQQFVDLARISAGKDTVIEGQRNEITHLHQQIEELKKTLEEKSQQLKDIETQLKQRDEEVTLLKQLSSEQTYMNTKLADTEKALEEMEKNTNDLIREHRKDKEADKARISSLEQLKAEHEAKLAENANTISALTGQVAELTAENQALKEKMEEDVKESTAKFNNYHDVQKEMYQEYEAVNTKNKELLKELRELKAELNRRDENYNTKTTDLSFKNLELENATLKQNSRIRELSFIVEQLTKEHMESARRSAHSSPETPLDAYSLG